LQEEEVSEKARMLRSKRDRAEIALGKRKKNVVEVGEGYRKVKRKSESKWGKKGFVAFEGEMEDLRYFMIEGNERCRTEIKS